MRTEVKVGIIVAMLMIGGGIFFILRQAKDGGQNVANVVPFGKEPAATPETAQRQARPQRPAEVPPTIVGRRDRARPLPGRPERTPTPRASRSPSGEPVTSAPGAPTKPKPDTAVAGPRPPAERARVAKPASSTAQPATRPGPLPAVAQPGPGVSPPPPPGVGPTRTGTLPRPPDRPRPGGAVPRKHTIVEEDTLWAIAEQYYGDGRLWARIQHANPDLNPQRLPVGQVIVIPAVEARPAAPPDKQRRSPTPPVTRPGVRRAPYIVEEGDTLTSIARDILGDPNRWKEIHELNKDKIPDPDVLKPGTELLLPAK